MILAIQLINIALQLLIVTFMVTTKTKKNVSSFSFYLLLFGSILWGVFLVALTNTTNPTIYAISSKLIFIFAAIAISSFTAFSLSYPKLKDKRALIILIIIGLIIISITTFTDGIVQSSNVDLAKINYGKLYIVFAAYAFLNPVIGTFILSRKISSGNLSEKEKQAIKYVVFSSLIAIALSLFTNIIIPRITGNSRFSGLGTLNTTISSMGILVAVYKHKFLNSRFLIGKITYYLILSAIAFTIFYLSNFIQNFFFGTIYDINSYILGFIIAIFFVIFFNLANNFIKKSIDNNLINPGYDPLVIVDDLNNALAVVFDINSIAEKILSSISKTIRPSFETIIITPSKTGLNPYKIDSNNKTNFLATDFLDALKVWQETGREPIILDDIEQELFSRYANEQSEIADLKNIMIKNKVKVLLPLGQNKEITGIMVLGEKEADSPYTVQDINFLESIANTARIAIERALFYEEVVDLNKNLQKKVDEATAELTTKNSELSNALGLIQESQRRERDMIDIMGHELRTPITIVRNAVSLLTNFMEKNTSVPPETLQKYTKMAYESAEREISLIETLLSATKVDSDHLQIFRENVDFLDVVNDSMLALKGRADRKGLQIIFNNPGKLPEVYADRTRIQEVMDNLLSNAIKYTEQGHVEIKLEDQGDFLKCSIIDTGYGIPKEDLANLGKKFYRVKTHVSGDSGQIVRPGGTGLGLYVTFAIVKVHGGQVFVESEVGKGSVFSFTVPKYTNQPIEKALRTQEKDMFKRLGYKNEKGENIPHKAQQREIAD